MFGKLKKKQKGRITFLEGWNIRYSGFHSLTKTWITCLRMGNSFHHLKKHNNGDNKKNDDSPEQ